MLAPKKINLQLPTTWNSCTIDQLETIAIVLLRHAAEKSIYKPFSLEDCKVELFFALSGINILENLNPAVPVEEQFCVCEYKGDIFDLYLWQIDYWIGEGDILMPDNSKTRKQHMLDFLEGPNKRFAGLTSFPYPVIKRGLLRKEFHGPSALMQDFSWQQYRFAQDWFDYHTRVSNQLLRMQKERNKYSDDDIKRVSHNVNLARASFLATIFNAKVKGVDEQIQQVYRAYEYRSNQHSDNAKYFRDFDPIKFQVICFWWMGMMHYLQKKYTHMFKVGSPDENSDSNPLEVYVRTSATLEKYTGFTEKEINSQLFHVILQHIDDMLKENEEIKRIRAKNKG